MSKKKYNFFTLLRDFNEQYHTTYRISNIDEAFLIYDNQSKIFSGVSYVTTSSFDIERDNIRDFTKKYITNTLPGSVASCIRNFVQNKEASNTKVEIKILPPNKIKYAYLDTNNYTVTGNLGSSCMRVKDMQKALNFYVKNDVRVVVVINSNNKIYARALLWNNVKSTKLKKPFTYLDRVYANSDTLLPLFYDLAKENNWKRYPSTTVNSMNKNYYIKDMNIASMCHLPFMDTFRYLYPESGLFTSALGLNINKNSDNCVTLDIHTNGGYYQSLDPNSVREALTNTYISKKD